MVVRLKALPTRVNPGKPWRKLEPDGWDIAISVYGKPVSKGRPRVTANGTFTPRETLDHEQLVGQSVLFTHRPRVDDKSDFEVDVVFYMPTRRGVDIDNLVKTVLDGLNAVVWKDDRQVTRVTAEVVRVDPLPRTELRIRRRDAGRS